MHWCLDKNCRPILKTGRVDVGAEIVASAIMMKKWSFIIKLFLDQTLKTLGMDFLHLVGIAEAWAPSAWCTFFRAWFIGKNMGHEWIFVCPQLLQVIYLRQVTCPLSIFPYLEIENFKWYLPYLPRVDVRLKDAISKHLVRIHCIPICGLNVLCTLISLRGWTHIQDFTKYLWSVCYVRDVWIQ